jgi:fused signal recognition particle receptor
LVLLSGGKLDEAAWEEVEDTLLSADLGVAATTDLVDALRTKVAVEGSTDEATVRGWLREELLALVDPSMDRSIVSSRVDGRPACVLVVGVNGTGKTTTVGKLARVLVAEDKDVVLGAADTFRAAAADQLQTWGERVGVPTVRSERDGADPAAVAFDAVKAAAEMEADVVLIDTAGRLQNKVGLMDELGKVKRVIEKLSPVDEVLLVLDGQPVRRGQPRDAATHDGNLSLDGSGNSHALDPSTPRKPHPTTKGSTPCDPHLNPRLGCRGCCRSNQPLRAPGDLLVDLGTAGPYLL